MELNRYQVLLSVIEHGSLSAAADSFGYTPSGISRMMAALEEEHGFPLLFRQKEGVLPTPDCQLLLPAIRELVFSGEKLNQLSSQILGLNKGSLTIGTAYSAYYGWISQITSRFHQAYPGIQITILNECSTQLVTLLEKHKADFAIISERKGNHRWIPLYTDPIVALLPPDHPLTKETAVPVQAFATEPYIEVFPETDIDNARVFKQCQIKPNTQFQTLDIYAVYAMVEAGLGISMTNQMNSRMWAGTIAVRPLSPGQYVTIGLASAEQPTPAAQIFLDFIQSNLPKPSFPNRKP